MKEPGTGGMRLCVIGETGSIHMQRWLRFFVGRGHEVHVVTVVPPEPESIPGVTVHPVPRRPGARGPAQALDYARMILGVRKAVRAVGPDLVNVMFVTDFGLFGALSGVRPLALTPWGSDVLRHPFQKRFWSMINSFAVRRADLLVSNSRHMRTTLVDKLGADGGRIIDAIWPGVDFSVFFPGDRAAARKKLGVEDGSVFVSTRNLLPIYNIDRILDMFARLRSRLPGALLLQAGEGPLLPLLRRRAERLGLGESVRFLGRVPQEALRDLFCAADVYLTVPRSDTTATSLLEAFACRANVVGSDIPANREWLRHGSNGFLAVPEDADGFAEICLQAARQPVPESVRDENFALVREKADHYRSMEKIESEFLRLARSGFLEREQEGEGA